MPAPIRDKTAVPPLPPMPRHLIRLHNGLIWLCHNVVTAPLGRLRWIYRYMNVYNRFIAPLAVCQRGCSACCSIDVELTETEAAMIARHTGRAYAQIAANPSTVPTKFLCMPNGHETYTAEKSPCAHCQAPCAMVTSASPKDATSSSVSPCRA